ERRSPQRVPAMLVVAVARALRSARSWLRHRAFGSAFFRSRQTTGIAGINRAAHRGSTIAHFRSPPVQHAVSCALSHGPLSHETPPRVAAFTAEPGQESPISRAFHAILSA